MPGLLSLLPSKSPQNLSYICSVNFLDLTDPISVTYHRHTKGSYLIEHVNHSIDVTETDYFGLKYLDDDKLECWLDPTKSIYSQLKGVSNPVFHFRVKFYPSDPDIVLDDVTRYQLYLQVQKDFEEGRLICPLKEALVLSAYVVQGVLGDYENIHATTPPNSATTPILDPISLSTPPVLDPISLTAPLAITTSTPKPSRILPIDYINEARLPESLRPFRGDIMLLHRRIKGMSQSTCELNFLKEASCLNSYGMHPYVVADMSGNNLYLTLTPKGIVIFEDNIATSFTGWNNVKKTTFDGKLFYVKSYINSTSPSLKGERETKTVAYRSSSSKACKQLWKNSVAHKFFFTLNSSEEAPKVLHSGGLLSRGGRFRYSGRCLNEMHKYSLSVRDDSKSISTDSAKKISSDMLKYSTLPRERNSSHIEEPYDGSEDEKSLLNKTATSIVLNYLSNTNEEGIYSSQSVTRSPTINNSSNLLEQHTNNEAITPENKNTNNRLDEIIVENEEPAPKAFNTLPSGKSTTKQHKFLSDNLNNTTKAISAATSRLKKFFHHKKPDKVRVEAHIEKSENFEKAETQKKSSIFENAALSHGEMDSTPTISTAIISTTKTGSTVSPSSVASSQPIVTSINLITTDTNTQSFGNTSKHNDKHSPTTLHTSTIVTTIRTTHSSTHVQPFDFNKSNQNNDDDSRDNYFNKNFNYVDETIRRTEEIIEKIDNSRNISMDSNRNVVFDWNDTGYLSGSDALNYSFDGPKPSNIKDISKKSNEPNVKNQTVKNAQNVVDNTQKDTKNASKEKLLNLLTYETSITDDHTSNKQASYQEQNISKPTNFITRNAQPGTVDTTTSPSNKNIPFNLSSHHQIPDLSPSTPSSSASKASTVLTPDAYECENLQDLEVPSNTTISSVIDQASTSVNTLGVLSEDNFEKIKEIRKLLQENKDKIQEIRENIDVEIRNSLNNNSIKKEFPPDYQFCYGEGLQNETGEEIEKEDETPSDDEEFKTANDVKICKPYKEYNEDDEESEETIFLDRNYIKNTKREASENTKENVPSSKLVPKPKHIAFSTKHYEWYSENGMGSGGGGVIYTFCGGPIGFGEVKCPSDCGLVKNSPVQEDIKVTDDMSKIDVQYGRKASIGRSISSIEGFYKADNVHHYNPNFDEEVEVVNQAFFDSNDQKPFEISVPKREDSLGVEERVVIGGADNKNPCENISKEEFISSKINDLTKPILNSADKKNLSKNKVTFSDHSLNSNDNIEPLSSLQKDVLTFDDLLQESKNINKPFCKILSENPDAHKIKNDFDKLNSKNISSTYSAKNFSYDLNELNKSPIEEDLIVPKVASILYDDNFDVENIKLEKVTGSQSKFPDDQSVKNTKEKETTKKDANTKSKNVKDTESTLTKDTKDKAESSEAAKDDKVVIKAKSRKRSCLKAMLTSSIFAVAFFSVAMVILFETNKDKEYFSNFGPISSFRNSVYDPYKDYLVCSFKKHFPSDIFGVD